MSITTTEVNFMSATVTPEALLEMLQHQRESFLRDGFPRAPIRVDRVRRLQSVMQNRQREMCEALSSDFGQRPETQSRMEILGGMEPLKNIIKNVHKWMKPERKPVPPIFRLTGGKARVFYQPLGVVGNVSPWNFPVVISLQGIADAFAAGNRVMLKPSELTPATSGLLKELLEKEFDATELRVVLGDAQVGAAFCKLPFDHILFTGAPSIARHVLRAAADNMVPVTLELGGKCPVVVGSDANLSLAAERILWGKIQNSGQICLAPDYVFVPLGTEEAFIAACRAQYARFYPKVPGNPDYVSIISDRHYQRITGYVDEARAKGVRTEPLQAKGDPERIPETRYIAPTIVVSPGDDLGVMRDEVFGPVFSLKTYDRIDEVIDFVNRNPRPLALYYFGKDKSQLRELESRTTSGGLTVNDIAMHAAFDTLPFGGVGNSGMGVHHGVYGFRQFSHAKAVYEQGWFNVAKYLNPPYGDRQKKILDMGIGKPMAR
jgi:coniferyl-aldehyde dehydrogenase